MESYIVWWLAQCDYERIPASIEEALPEHISDQVRSRKGRAGRGRLWIADGVPLEEISWDDTKPLASEAIKSGGIVLKLEDAKYILGLPGFITDTSMNQWIPAK